MLKSSLFRVGLAAVIESPIIGWGKSMPTIHQQSKLHSPIAVLNFPYQIRAQLKLTMKITKIAFAALLMTGAALFTSCKESAPADSEVKPEASEETEKKVLVLSAIPNEKISDQEASYKALAKYLSSTLGVEVAYDVSEDYTSAVTRFANDEVHLMWFGGLTGVQARAKVEGARAIAQGVVDPQYKSYFIAHKDTGLKKSDEFPKEIADMSFTFGSKSSTSGRLMPTYFIQQETGKKPQEFFKAAPQFSKTSHAGTAKTVNKGSVQIGAISYKTFDKMKAAGELPDCDIIWETPGYADYNFTAHPSLDKMFGEGFIDKLQKALVDCKDEKALGAILREEGLIPAKNSDFDGIVKVARELEFIR